MTGSETRSGASPLGAAEIEWFAASDGYRFACHHWSPATAPPRGYVVGLHGIQSHVGWYVHSSARLAQAGYDVCFLDRRGSGVNGPPRGHAPHGDRLINDVAQFLTVLRRRRARESAAAPIVLMSISWGAKLGAAVAARRPDLVDALVLLNPGIFTRVRPAWPQEWLIRAVRFFDVKWRSTPVPLDDPELFTFDLAWQAFIRDDPLALRTTTIGFQHSSRDLDRIVRASPQKIACPVLAILAGKDRIADNTATRAFCRRIGAGGIGAGRVRCIEYEDSAHTIEFDPNRDRLIGDLIDWLEGLPRGPTGPNAPSPLRPSRLE